MRPTVPQCPWCGAPLPVLADEPIISCGFCRSRVRIGDGGRLSLDGNRTLGNAAHGLLAGQRSGLVLGPAAGVLTSSIVVACLEPYRDPVGLMVTVGVFLGILALAGQRIVAALFAFGVGAMVFARPFVAPLLCDYAGNGCSPTSESGLHYLIPAAISIAIAALLASRFRPAGWRQGLWALVPRPRTAVAFVVAAAIPVWPAWTGRSLAAAYERHDAAIRARSVVMDRVRKTLDAPLGAFVQAKGLTPAPSFVHGDGNTDVAPRRALDGIGDDPGYGLTFATASFLALRRERWRQLGFPSARLVSGSDADAEMRAALAKRYLVVYWPKSPVDERMGRPADVGWYQIAVFDLANGSLLACTGVPGGDWNRSRTEMMLALETATGGTFRD
jgi:hypothetical protein